MLSQITLPGFKVGKPSMEIAANTYPTNFSDLAEPEANAYSRLTLSIPVSRPMVAKVVPGLICATLPPVRGVSANRGVRRWLKVWDGIPAF